MEELKLGTVESKFADIIWENEPISSGQLVKLCGQQLDWKKSTTYTMLKRLCERGLFQNEKGMVSALMTKEEFGAAQSEKLLRNPLMVHFLLLLQHLRHEKDYRWMMWMRSRK